MAVATTTFTPSAMVFPYEGLPTLGGDHSQHPFAELRFNILAGTVAVEAGGDSQKIDVQVTLPRNFAYTPMDVHFSIFGADFADWEAFADCFWTDGLGTGPNPRTVLAPIPCWNEGVSGTLRSYRFDFERMGVLKPGGGGSTPQFRVLLVNPVINGSAMTVNFSARFLQYNIEQAHYFAVNSPTPTR